MSFIEIFAVGDLFILFVVLVTDFKLKKGEMLCCTYFVTKK